MDAKLYFGFFLILVGETTPFTNVEIEETVGKEFETHNAETVQYVLKSVFKLRHIFTFLFYVNMWEKLSFVRRPVKISNFTLAQALSNQQINKSSFENVCQN